VPDVPANNLAWLLIILESSIIKFFLIKSCN